MNHIFLNSVISQKSIEEIKFLALYYDKISVVNDAIYTIALNLETKEPYVKPIKFLPETFEDDYKILIDAGLLEIVNRVEDEKDKEFDSKYAKSISEFLNGKRDFIFPKTKNGIGVSDEIKDIITYTFNKQEKTPLDLIWWFYAFKLKWSIRLMLNGQKCINSSKNLEYLFHEYINCNKKPNIFDSSRLVVKAINLSLPSCDMLSFEDILELKYKLRIELEEFSNKIHMIELKYRDIDMTKVSIQDYNSIFYTEIQSPYENLQNKIKSLKGKTYLSFIKKAKDIKSYIPIIGSIVASVPLEYSLLVSLGIIGIESWEEYKINKREIDYNGFNYLVKLKR